MGTLTRALLGFTLTLLWWATTTTATAQPPLGKARCPATQMTTTLLTRKDANKKILKRWCIGTKDARNTTGEAYVASEWIMEGAEGMVFWIHKCGLPNADNSATETRDLSKRVKIVNTSQDGKDKVEYDFNPAADGGPTLTITTTHNGVQVDTKQVLTGDLPVLPSKVPHPGEDLRFGTEDDVDPVGDGCFSDIGDLTSEAAVPTLSPSILAVLAAMLAGLGVRALRKRRCTR